MKKETLSKIGRILLETTRKVLRENGKRFFSLSCAVSVLSFEKCEDEHEGIIIFGSKYILLSSKFYFGLFRKR